MKRPHMIAAAVAAALTASAGMAHAVPHVPNPVPVVTSDVQQVHHTKRHYGHVLPRRAIVRSLYHRGYRDVHRVRFHKGYWRARALGRRGVVALKIDPYNGHIVRRKLIRHYGSNHHRPRHYRKHQRGGVTFSFGFH